MSVFGYLSLRTSQSPLGFSAIDGFMLSLQDTLDEDKLVNVFEDWDVLAEYAGNVEV